MFNEDNSCVYRTALKNILVTREINDSIAINTLF